MSKTVPQYKVVLWDFNGKCVEFYDIFPYLITEWKWEEHRVKNRLKNLKRHKERDFEAEAQCVMISAFDDIRKWIMDVCRYRFHSRCEYEILVTGFPPSDEIQKIDAFNQIEANIDIITETFIQYITK